MPEHAHLPYLHEIILFLVIAALIIPVLRKLGMSVILSYLLIGLLIGPYGLAQFTDIHPELHLITITDTGIIQPFAEMGVVFLFFMIGLELSPERLWQMRTTVFGLGTLQVVITAIAIGIIARSFGNDIETSILLGGSLALSSTAIILQWFNERRQLGTHIGKTVFSVLLLQDLAVIPLLFMVSAFAGNSGDAVGNFGSSLLTAIITALLILFIGRKVLRPLFRFVGSFHSAEVFVALALLIIVGTAAIAQSAGLSMALGAFLAGLLLAETEYRYEIESYIDPYRGLLLGLFFLAVGMGIDYRILLNDPAWILGSVAGLIFIKASIIITLCFFFGMTRQVAIPTGIYLAQGGEFAFVIVGMATSFSLLPESGAQFMLMVTGISMLLTPFLAQLAERIGAYLEVNQPEQPYEHDDQPLTQLDGHVIIAGYGRVGRLLSNLLAKEGVSFIALDKNTNRVAKYREAGIPIYYGDITKPETLRHARAGEAATLVLTLDNAQSTERALNSIKAEFPLLPVCARVKDVTQALEITKEHDIMVIPENLEASLELAGNMLQLIGYSEEVARQMVAEQRKLAWEEKD
jgi:CPA2 family monovalent cation:H+ antiporter-2